MLCFLGVLVITRAAPSREGEVDAADVSATFDAREGRGREKLQHAIRQVTLGRRVAGRLQERVSDLRRSFSLQLDRTLLEGAAEPDGRPFSHSTQLLDAPGGGLGAMMELQRASVSRSMSRRTAPSYMSAGLCDNASAGGSTPGRSALVTGGSAGAFGSGCGPRIVEEPSQLSTPQDGRWSRGTGSTVGSVGSLGTGYRSTIG